METKMSPQDVIAWVLSGQHIGDVTKSATLLDAATLLKVLADRLEEISKTKSAVQSAYDYVRITLIPGLMDEAGIRTVTFDGIGRVTLTGDAHIHVPAAQRLELHDWLTANGYDDLISQTVNASTLKAWAMGRMKQGEEIPEIIKISPFTRASITKA